MPPALLAGALHAAVALAAGFALGTFRVLVLAPRLGETAAVLAELPAMLALGWVVAGALLRRCAVPAWLPSRAAMALSALVLLMLAEAGLGLWLFGRSLAEQRAALATLPGALGLAGQVTYAAMPLMRRGRNGS